MKLNATTWILLSACSCQVKYNCLNEIDCDVWFFYIVIWVAKYSILLMQFVEWNSMQHQLFKRLSMCDFFLVCMLGKFESAFYACHQFVCVHLLRL